VSDPARARERLQELRAIVFSSEDAKEGATAFVEKRAPVWRGR
jgi:enoyl-CoA hydratase/carnithine racemase